MRKPRSIRQKRAVDEEEEEQDIASAEEGQPQALSAEEIKALQKQRLRKTVSALIPVPKPLCHPLFFGLGCLPLTLISKCFAGR